ncbi:hypothetical protein KOW79_012679 [Hemibagrus wyckioides]|uniref:Ig-like domain-containing protein n=2 Tax=Hemibagrus wyckioides TaxID=337641 RepID=A0A9D3SMC0_9TELE|nr:hypothetical protein KOW79_012679 [Hemibagrus wyckioides]
MAVVCAFVTLGVLAPALGGEHSLFYTYTALSKPIDLPGIYEFTALGMLDDRELDYYNSKTQAKIPKQDWMKEKMGQDYWDKGTQSRKSKEQWFKVNVDILMDRMRHNKSDLHVLQWRHGCVVEGENGDGTFVRGIDEYSYDGSEFLSFDEENSRWIAPVPAAEPTKKKWDEVPILNTYTKSYLEKECVDWLIKFMEYGQDEERQHFSQSPPDVHLLTKKSVTSSKQLILTCLATGFYPPNVQMQLRKSRTSLPEHLVTSSGVRPNGDGTYQLRKSVEILENELPLYDCFVNHSALDEPLIKSTDCKDCKISLGKIIGVLISLLLLLLVVAGVIYILYSKGIIPLRHTATNVPRTENGNVAYIPAPVADPEANGHANGHTNGHANGHTNGHANGHTDGHANGHTDGHANGLN